MIKNESGDKKGEIMNRFRNNMPACGAIFTALLSNLILFSYLSGFDGAICSHFVVCNADSTTQVCAIAAEIEEKVFEKLGEKVWRIEGQQNGVWVAMDYVDVVVHIFQTELRSFYKLEELWADAPLVKYEYEE